MSLLPVFGSLLGGIFGKPKTVTAGANIRSHVDGAMQAARDNHLNPMTVLGIPPIGPSSVANPMGAAIADASVALADHLAGKKKELAEIGQLKAANQRLQKAVTHQTLRPKVPGVYGQNAVQSVPEVVAAPPNPVEIDYSNAPPAVAAWAKGLIGSYLPTFTEAASDMGKGIAKLPIIVDGEALFPSGRNVDAAVIEDTLGDDGPASTVFKWWIGLDEGAHLLRQHSKTKGTIAVLDNVPQVLRQWGRSVGVTPWYDHTKVKPIWAGPAFEGNHTVPRDWWKQQP